MPTRSITKLDSFLFGSEKHPVFSMHSFTRLTLQGSVNFQFFVPTQFNFSLLNFCVQYYIAYVGMSGHNCQSLNRHCK